MRGDFTNQSTGSDIAVDVCICTYRRPQVLEAIHSVAKQALPPHIRVRLVIADNSAEASARDLVAGLANKFAIAVHYLHAPGANISIARNACLDFAEGDWIAFLDDDELASPGWLANLLANGCQRGHRLWTGSSHLRRRRAALAAIRGLSQRARGLP